MKLYKVVAAILVPLFSWILPAAAWPIADQIDETRHGQIKQLNRNELQEWRRWDQTENLKRDQQLQNFQQELERKKQATDNDPQARQKINERQRLLDNIKSDQQLERAQRDLLFDQIQREHNSLRQQQQIRELQRQQQMDLLRDQLRKTQQDLDRLR